MCMPKRRLNDDHFTVSGAMIGQLGLTVAANLALEGDGKSNCNQCTAL